MLPQRMLPQRWIWGCMGLLAGLAGVFLGLLVACSFRAPFKGEPEIHIGVLAPLSGEFAESGGLPIVNAALLAAQQVNDRGGLVVREQSYHVVLHVEDDQDTPQLAVEAARKLIVQDRVVALVGAPLSRIAIPVATVAENEGIPLISPSSTNPATTQGKRYVFRMAFLDSFQGQAIARFVSQDLGVRRAAVLYDIASAYNRDLAKFFRQQFEADGGEVVAFESYTTDEQDWSHQLATIHAQTPEVLFLPNYTTEVLSQVRQARQMAITATLVGGDAWSNFTSGERAEMNGAYYSAHWWPRATSEATQAFVEAYQRAYGYLPTDQNAALTYDAFGMLFQAIQEAGKTDPASIRDGLARMTRYTGVTGHMEYHGTGDPSRSIVMLQIREGEAVFSRQIDP